jgi:hypothetical protein
MALPDNGSIRNLVSEGYYIDYSDQNKARRLHHPTWGFRAADFVMPSNVVNVTSSGALVAAMTGGNRVAQIASGNYDWSAKALPGDNIVIQGAGMNATKLTLTSGIGTSQGTYALDANRKINLVLRDLEIDLNRQGFISLLFRMCNNVLIERCRIHDGFRLNLRMPSTTRWTVRFCEIYNTGDLHCLSASVETSGASPGTEYPSYFSVYSNRLYGAGSGGHGLDLHAEYGEVCGNDIYGNGDAQTKQPDSVELYFHRNKLGSGSLYGTRIYGTKRASPAFTYYYDNWYLGSYVRAFHVGGENTTTAVSNSYWANNRFGPSGTTTPSVIGGNRVVYVKPGTLEASASGGGLTTAAQSLIDKIDALRALDGGATVPPPVDPPPPPVTAGAPYPNSTYITNWQWTGDIAQIGAGGDNWPNTWVTSSRLYIAGGDWNGFSNAYAKQSATVGYVTGTPPTIIGTNVLAFEAAGNGRTGRKFSGLFFANGVLYGWLRNADRDGHHARLISSADSGATWNEHFTFTEFAYCTFVQFGQANANARDTYTYIMTPNGSDAYTGYDSFVLMRVPTTAITNRSAYEFYAGPDASGKPTWSSNIVNRDAVFSHQDRCSRSGISYNSHIQRYIWWQSHYTSASGNAGFGVYEAPEPWGPWTTVFFAKDAAAWDRDAGDAGHFPTSWMASDGSYMWALFSGDDALSVRRATYDVPGVQPAGQWSGRIAASGDDAEQLVGDFSITLNSPELNADINTYIGLRFVNVDVPRGSVIRGARLRVTAASSSGAATTLTIYAESATNPPPYVATNNNIGLRNRGGAVVWQNVPTWNFNQVYISPDLTTLIQEIVSRPDWSGGMAIGLQMWSSGDRRIKSYENDATQAPQLLIDFDPAAVDEGSTLYATIMGVGYSLDMVEADILSAEIFSVTSAGYSLDTINARTTVAGADIDSYRGLLPVGGIY